MSEVDEVIKNAVRVDVAERFGEDQFVRNVMVIGLVETPRQEGDKPNDPRFQLYMKTLESIHPQLGVNMLKEAAAQFLRQANEGDNAT